MEIAIDLNVDFIVPLFLPVDFVALRFNGRLGGGVGAGESESKSKSVLLPVPVPVPVPVPMRTVKPGIFYGKTKKFFDRKKERKKVGNVKCENCDRGGCR